MGRRSSHTPQQLRALIIDAAQEIIEAQGLAGLSAREIARRVGYSPGTIYNIFANLDDVVLNVEARVLDALDRRLGETTQPLNGVGTGGGNSPGHDMLRNAGRASGRERLLRLAHAYLAVAQEKPRLWNLLAEHHMPRGEDLPAWYRQKLEASTAHIERALASWLAAPASEAERQHAARVLWAGVHGIASLSTADKLSLVTADTAARLIDNLIATYLAGLAAGQPPGPQGP